MSSHWQLDVKTILQSEIEIEFLEQIQIKLIY